jgi:hypothetical protein
VSRDIKLSDLVEGKNVLLVGNSSSLLESDKSSFIDSFEFVIRFNLSIAHLHKHRIGRRCDAWVYAMVREHICKNTFHQARVKPKHCVRYGDPFPLGNSYMELDVIKDDVRKEVGISADMYPSTGIATLYYLLNKANCGSISLIGYDSFKKHNFYTKTNNAHKCHNLDLEAKYLEKFVGKEQITIY